jgi:hypothetical protein
MLFTITFNVITLNAHYEKCLFRECLHAVCHYDYPQCYRAKMSTVKVNSFLSKMTMFDGGKIDEVKH